MFLFVTELLMTSLPPCLPVSILAVMHHHPVATVSWS